MLGLSCLYSDYSCPGLGARTTAVPARFTATEIIAVLD